MKKRVAVKVLARLLPPGYRYDGKFTRRQYVLMRRASNVRLGPIGSRWFTRYELRVLGHRTDFPDWMKPQPKTRRA